MSALTTSLPAEAASVQTPAPAGMNAARSQPLLRTLVRGLVIDAQAGDGGVVHLRVRAHQQHKGAWGRVRQHAANALFRAADLCHPSNNDCALRVVAGVVFSTPVDHDLPDGGDPDLVDVWPVHGADGDAYYHPFLVHEGVKRLHDGRPAVHQGRNLGRQIGADDLRAIAPQTAEILRQRKVDAAAETPAQATSLSAAPQRLGLWLRIAALLIAVFTLLVTSGCASTRHAAPSALVQASCPPLTPEPKRQDIDALRTRAAEVTRWYQMCRDAVLQGDDMLQQEEPQRLSPGVPAAWGMPMRQPMPTLPPLPNGVRQ
jgi:hypothetical protein